MQEIDCGAVSGCVSTATQAATTSELQVRLRASPAAISRLRTELRAWLSDSGASGDETLDLQIACSEVLTMVIKDAAALVVDVQGWIRGGLVSVAIRDYGLCRDVNRIELDQEGTFGVALIQAVVDDLDIRWHADGRMTVLSRRLGRVGSSYVDRRTLGAS
jgi:anti-sigma regulatory factor (Ser/Thr protein kinase)